MASTWEQILRLPALVLRDPARLGAALGLGPGDEALAGRLSEAALVVLGERRFVPGHFRARSPLEPAARARVYEKLQAGEPLSAPERVHLECVAADLMDSRFLDSWLFESDCDGLAMAALAREYVREAHREGKPSAGAQ